jgi:thiol:disulfide interchange protein DsbD
VTLSPAGRGVRAAVFLSLLLLLVPLVLQAAPHTKASLLTAATAVRAGDSTTVGILLQMPKPWHTYWVNPGDSGGPTEVRWVLPAGFEAGALQWPAPEKYDVAGIITYVYHGEVMLLAPVRVAVDVPAGRYELKAEVDWLECAELCLPGSAEVAVSVDVGPSTVASAEAARFELWRQRLPKLEAPPGLRAAWEGPAAGEKRALLVEWISRTAGSSADFFALPSQGYQISPVTERLAGSANQARLRVHLTRQGTDWPVQVRGLLVEGEGNQRTVYESTLTIASGAGSDTSSPAAAPAGDEGKPSLWLMLWFAFVGGLILNIMPCVLPVVALKVLGFISQARESAAEVRRHGLVYGVGVLVSFLALASVVLLVQAGGRAASWGMQFQNPIFLVAMTSLVTLVALNLFGLFEITLSGRAVGAAASLASKSGAAGAFFNGVLATVLATPCTAPFLGLALGFAFTQPAPVVVVMFLAVGLGLALPYVAICFVPALARFLPKPGLWMERFKVAMGFPMAATAFWLLSLLSRHYGPAGVLWIGVFLVLLALAAWVWGQFVQRGTRVKAGAILASGALLLLGYLIVLEGQLRWRSPARREPGAAPVTAAGGIAWQPWSAEAVAQGRAAGRPILVDFTADWCVTCQANKKTSLEIGPVQRRLRELDAVSLLGDYTLRDDRITEELRRWGRAGVPLVLVYPKDPAQAPRVLPEVLTPGLVLEALDWAGR